MPGQPIKVNPLARSHVLSRKAATNLQRSQVTNVAASGANVRQVNNQILIEGKPGMRGGGGGLGIVSAADKTALDLILANPPKIGRTRDNDHYYVRSDGAWLGISHWD